GVRALRSEPRRDRGVGRGSGAARAPDRARGAGGNRDLRPDVLARRGRAGLARVEFRRGRGAPTRAPGDAGARGHGVPAQHPPRVLFHLLGRAVADAGGGVSPQPAGAGQGGVGERVNTARARCRLARPADWIAARIARLPQAWLLRLGAVLAGLGAPLLRRRRRIAARNLELCFPELDRAARWRL